MSPSDPDEAATYARSYWKDIKSDVKATLEEYHANGYEAVMLHPGVTTVLSTEYDDELCGLNVLVPRAELEEVASMTDTDRFDSAEIYNSHVGSLVLLGLFFFVEDPSRVVGFHSYYLPSEAETMLEEAREAGELSIRLHSQRGDDIVIDCQHPELFVPDGLE